MNYASPASGLYIYNGVIRVDNFSMSYPIMIVDDDVLDFAAPALGSYYYLDIVSNQFKSAPVDSVDLVQVVNYVISRYDINLNAEDLLVVPSLTKDEIIGRIG